MIRRILKKKKGQGFVEYALLVAGVALVGAIGVTILGEKTNEILAGVAATLPGVNGVNNAPIVAGALLEYDTNGNGDLVLDFQQISLNNDGTNPRLTNNINDLDSGSNLEDNVVEVFPN